MENLTHTFILLDKNISLNLDILETGLLNILALIALLVYTGRDFLGSLLEERRITILNSVQDAEDRLKEAQKRLSEAEKQLNQVNIVISEIKNETITTKKLLLESEVYETRKDLKNRFERAVAAFRSKEREIVLEIKNQIILIVLKQTVTRVKEKLKSNEQAAKLIDETINKLEGDLL